MPEQKRNEPVNSTIERSTEPLAVSARIRGRRSSFIPAPADAALGGLMQVDARAERLTFATTVILASIALISTAGFATAILVVIP